MCAWNSVHQLEHALTSEWLWASWNVLVACTECQECTRVSRDRNPQAPLMWCSLEPTSTRGSQFRRQRLGTIALTNWSCHSARWELIQSRTASYESASECHKPGPAIWSDIALREARRVSELCYQAVAGYTRHCCLMYLGPDTPPTEPGSVQKKKKNVKQGLLGHVG